MIGLDEKLCLEILDVSIISEVRKMLVFLAKNNVEISKKILDTYESQLKLLYSSFKDEKLNLYGWYKNNKEQDVEVLSNLIERLQKIVDGVRN